MECLTICIIYYEKFEMLYFLSIPLWHTWMVYDVCPIVCTCTACWFDKVNATTIHGHCRSTTDHQLSPWYSLFFQLGAHEVQTALNSILVLDIEQGQVCYVTMGQATCRLRQIHVYNHSFFTTWFYTYLQCETWMSLKLSIIITIMKPRVSFTCHKIPVNTYNMAKGWYVFYT